jgi:hypothetical protein
MLSGLLPSGSLRLYRVRRSAMQIGDRVQNIHSGRIGTIRVVGEYRYLVIIDEEQPYLNEGYTYLNNREAAWDKNRVRLFSQSIVDGF